MADKEEVMKILKMVEDGKVSAEEGVELLSVLGDSRENPAGSAPVHGKGGARLLHIRITDTRTGRSKTSVQIPVGLVDAGMKMGAQFTPSVEGVDMSNVMNAVRSGVTGKIIDMTDDEEGEHIEIYVE